MTDWYFTLTEEKKKIFCN